MTSDTGRLAKTLHDAGWTAKDLMKLVGRSGGKNEAISCLTEEMLRLECSVPRGVWDDRGHWKLTDSRGNSVMIGLHSTGMIYLMSPGIGGFFVLLSGSDVREVLDALAVLAKEVRP